MKNLGEVSRELKLIRRSIRRSRWSTAALTVALVLSVVVGVFTALDDRNDDRRERDNLVFLLRTRCEKYNENRRNDAEVLIGAAEQAGSQSPESQAAIDEYRRRLDETETDCDAEVASLLP